MLGRFDDDVLQQVAEIGFDRALEAGFDLEVVGERATLSDLAVRLREDGTRRVAVLGSRRFELFERLQPRVETGNLLFMDAHRPGTPLVFGPGTRELGLVPEPGHACRLDRLLRTTERVGCHLVIGGDPLGLNAHIVGFDLQFGQAFRRPGRRRRRRARANGAARSPR